MKNVIDNLYYKPELFKDHPVVIDAGARYGHFTKRILQEQPNTLVLAIEPETHAHLELSKLKTAYHFESFKGILWYRIGKKKFYLWNNPQNSVFPRHPSDKMPKERKVRYTEAKFVPCITLEQIIGKYNYIDLLKMNIEGAEFPVLENSKQMTMDNIGQITMEVHTGYNKRYSLEKMMEILDSRNFEAKMLKTFDWDNYIVYGRNRNI